MTYYVYENWRAHGHQSRVHRAECGQCNNGCGVAGGTRSDNGKWHGPYGTFNEADDVSRKLPGEHHLCKICRPSA